MAYIIVFGNEKGGSGKTTTAMHTIIGLLNMGFDVASIDIDERQQSLSRYIENRKRTKEKFNNDKILMPEHFEISQDASKKNSIQDNEDNFISLLKDLDKFKFIIMDAPGNNTKISEIAHSYADLVITPVNDSFIDLDLLAKIKINQNREMDMVSPGIYSSMFFSQKLKRASRNKQEIDWIVVRNRLSAMDLLNKRNVDFVLRQISKKLGFRIVPGFGDRVIFKELFLQGLTVIDENLVTKVRATPSIVSARKELRDFIAALNLKDLKDINVA